jgi:hypothetical protein
MLLQGSGTMNYFDIKKKGSMMYIFSGFSSFLCKLDFLFTDRESIANMYKRSYMASMWVDKHGMKNVK